MVHIKKKKHPKIQETTFGDFLEVQRVRICVFAARSMDLISGPWSGNPDPMCPVAWPKKKNQNKKMSFEIYGITYYLYFLNGQLPASRNATG